MSKSGKSKVLSIPKFLLKIKEEALTQARANNEELVLTPQKLQELYEQKYPNLEKKDSSAFRKALLRSGMTQEKRAEFVQEQRKALAHQDILEYQNVKDYIANAELGHVQQSQIKNQLDNLRALWEIMLKTDPNSWTLTSILAHIREFAKLPENKDKYQEVVNERDQKVFEHPAAVKALLSPYSTMWKGKLPNNWTANFAVSKAGDLKDFFRFNELEEFLNKLLIAAQGSSMTYQAWKLMFLLHINLGCREGSLGNTGIVSLLWEDINFETKRCSLREKGHRGNAGERWNNLPLNMFGFLHAFEELLIYWQLQGKPTKGQVFPVTYGQYNEMFHKACRLCNNRLNQIDTTDSIRLHTFGRRTHAQYCQRLGIPLELICGKAPSGRFGVGWKDPKILVNYYLSEESEEINKEELEYMNTHPEFKQVLKTMQEQNEKIKKLLGSFEN